MKGRSLHDRAVGCDENYGGSALLYSGNVSVLFHSSISFLNCFFFQSSFPVPSSLLYSLPSSSFLPCFFDLLPSFPILLTILTIYSHLSFPSPCHLFFPVPSRPSFLPCSLSPSVPCSLPPALHLPHLYGGSFPTLAFPPTKNGDGALYSLSPTTFFFMLECPSSYVDPSCHPLATTTTTTIP